MIDITFLPKNKTMAKPITYHVNETNNVIATYKAKQFFMKEHAFRYYNRVAITETRVL